MYSGDIYASQRHGVGIIFNSHPSTNSITVRAIDSSDKMNSNSLVAANLNHYIDGHHGGIIRTDSGSNNVNSLNNDNEIEAEYVGEWTDDVRHGFGVYRCSATTFNTNIDSVDSNTIKE